MRTAFFLMLAAATGGCAVVPPAAWDFDPARPAPRSERPAQLAPMTQRLAQLQIERNAIRARIAGERDVRERLGLYEQLHRVGMELSPLERQMAGYR